VSNVARLDPATAWAAFMRRDRAWDGRVIGAVKSTGIYCKPSCPARHPKPENVVFYATAEEARAAGYRPCLRCKPDEVGRDRVAAAKQAVAEGVDIVICDDGLQHLALVRHCEMVVIDGQRGFGNGCLLPRGPLREGTGRLRRVNAVIVNGPATAPNFQLPSIVTRTHFAMNMRPGDARPVRGGGSLRSLSSFRGTGVHAVAAIGNPQRFFDTLRAAGLTLYEHPMPDHHPFKPGDLNFGDALPILMTEKDAVKCAAFADERCWYVPVTAEFPEAEAEKLVELVLARAATFKTQTQ
jgi:tetraacyldisaccharide 4'-kinase